MVQFKTYGRCPLALIAHDDLISNLTLFDLWPLFSFDPKVVQLVCDYGKYATENTLTYISLYCLF